MPPLLYSPAVGTFSASMKRLRDHGLVELLRKRIASKRPTMAVCVGLQLLCETSEESPEATGLGLIAGGATRYPTTVRVPHFGWNLIQPEKDCTLLAAGYAYFANSYRLTSIPEGWKGALSEHAGPFVAALEKGPLLACQFHPELSGSLGHELMKRWLITGIKYES
jgi:imidazole glycerol phosphate synthase glutamine amidotransferase subunit